MFSWLKKKELNAAIIAMCTILFFIYTWILDEHVLDPGDGISHFQVANYSWKYPSLFFNHWGKPLFTLLSSPFAQFGFKGMLIFNTLLFTLTAFISAKITKQLKLENGWIAVLLTFVAPIYFRVVLSGLTEILLATLLTVSLYFFLKKKYTLGCIILSFSILARPESYIIIPFYGLYLVALKKYKFIPLLATGFVAYSFAGYFQYNDLFWIINKRPYSSGASLYGSGDLFHFIKNSGTTFGKLTSLLFVLGGIGILVNLIRKKLKISNHERAWIFLILLPVIAVIGVHSVLWWMGTQGSAGLLRITATIIPLVSLVALYAINDIQLIALNKFKALRKEHVLVLLILISGFITYKRVKVLEMDERMIIAEELLLDAALWYQQNAQEKKIYYMPPYFAYKAKIDPYSKNGLGMAEMRSFKDKKVPSNNMKSGEFILWEGQFAPKEGRLPLASLMNDPNLMLLKVFIPEENIQFYEKEYSVVIFKKQ